MSKEVEKTAIPISQQIDIIMREQRAYVNRRKWSSGDLVVIRKGSMYVTDDLPCVVLEVITEPGGAGGATDPRDRVDTRIAYASPVSETCWHAQSMWVEGWCLEPYVREEAPRLADKTLN